MRTHREKFTFFIKRCKVLSKPNRGITDLSFFNPQPDTSLYTATEQIVVCLFTPEISLVLIVSTYRGWVGWVAQW